MIVIITTITTAIIMVIMSKSRRARCRRPAQTGLARTALSWTRRRVTRSPLTRRARSERQACARCLTGLGWLGVERAGSTVSTNNTVWAAAKGLGVGPTAVGRSGERRQHSIFPSPDLGPVTMALKAPDAARTGLCLARLLRRCNWRGHAALLRIAALRDRGLDALDLLSLCISTAQVWHWMPGRPESAAALVCVVATPRRA